MPRKPKLCWQLDLAGYDIKLEQAGRDRFIVTYGKQVSRELNYHDAALDLGASIMHALACESKLDNRSKGEA